MRDICDCCISSFVQYWWKEGFISTPFHIQYKSGVCVFLNERGIGGVPTRLICSYVKKKSLSFSFNQQSRVPNPFPAHVSLFCFYHVSRTICLRCRGVHVNLIRFCSRQRKISCDACLCNFKLREKKAVFPVRFIQQLSCACTFRFSRKKKKRKRISSCYLFCLLVCAYRDIDQSIYIYTYIYFL